MHIHTLALVLFTVLALNTAPTRAQSTPSDYPSRPVTLIDPAGAGGSSDLNFRMFNQSILESTGKRFIIDSKPGAGTTIGTAYVAKAQPDGHTLLIVNTAFVLTPSIYPDLPYDTIRDFSPVSLMVKTVFVVVVHPSAPFRNIREYVAYARQHPDELNYGTTGMGSPNHMPGALLHYMTNTRVTFIQYKTPPQRMLDLIAGRVQVAMGTPTLSMQYIKDGKLRAIGVTSDRRLPIWPDLPTIAEQGVPGYDYTGAVGLVAPAKTPPAIINKLNELYVRTLKDPLISGKIEAEGSLVGGSSPEEFRQHLIKETNKWRTLIKDTGMKIEAN